MNQMTAVIVDDEQRSSKALSRLLVEHHPDVVIMGIAEDVPGGLDLILRASPQLLFLDIELKDRKGFEILQVLGDRRPHVIFTTAHESYAVKAIRFSALDYLLKPIAPSDLKAAIERARKVIEAPVTNEKYEALLKNLDRSSGDRMVALPVADGLEMVHVNEIVQCESDSNYTTVHLREGKRLLISRTLKEFEDLLGDQEFMRIHNCHLVQIKHIKKYIRGDGGEVLISTGLTLPVARRKKQELLDSLDRL